MLAPSSSRSRLSVRSFAFVATFLLSLVSARASDEIDYVERIRPILATRCFNCHGPDEGSRAAELRLDRREDAYGAGESGETAIVPGDPDASELIARIRSDEAGYRMPPSDHAPPMPADEIELLERWIASGAAMQDHWSFQPPAAAAPPLTGSSWPRRPLDAFALAKLEQLGLSPADEAEPAVLARRLSLDLVGLPPDRSDVDELLAGERPDAVERYVDRLLASPAFGERWGALWLDLARYADSQGYAQDSPRNIWRYRDWVIDAINADMPFDAFTIEQLAGDLLDDPTDEQRIATAFHRNTMTNSEGGTDDEEFRSAAVVDRVVTTMQVWMGVTMACAQCHSHKYDPITQHEFFRLYAVWNQTEDQDHPEELPLLSLDSAEQRERRAALAAEVARLEALVAAQAAEAAPTLPPLAADAPLEVRHLRIELPGADRILSLAEVQAFVGERNVATAGVATQSSTDYEGDAARGIDGNTDGDYAGARSTTHSRQGADPWWEVDLGSPMSIDRIAIWNRSDAAGIGERLRGARLVLLDAERRPLWIAPLDPLPAPSLELTIPATAGERTEATLAAIDSWWRESGAGATPETIALAAARKQLDELKPDVVTPVMRELPTERQRRTFVHLRGNFRAPGDEVTAGLPTAFGPTPAIERPTRLDVARWLVGSDNPLTARVIVNRHWEQLFGTGLVETAEDFGTQGAWPSHPQLLDHTAVNLRERGWGIKFLLRELATSATYRQSSEATDEKLRLDPQGTWLSRGPRFRLPAETIRDQALAIGGLLSRKMHGPSVRPIRPKLGLSSAFGGSTDWETSPGEDARRRGLYTSWRRTTPYPSMTMFDATSREVCTVRRIRTNTPLQALVTLNDPVYVEAAQGLARRLLTEGSTDRDERLARLVELTLLRAPTAEELDVLRAAHDRTRDQMTEDPASAETLATRPLGPLPPQVDPIEAAVWTVLANVMLNLDETLARP